MVLLVTSEIAAHPHAWLIAIVPFRGDIHEMKNKRKAREHEIDHKHGLSALKRFRTFFVTLS